MQRKLEPRELGAEQRRLTADRQEHRALGRPQREPCVTELVNEDNDEGEESKRE